VASVLLALFLISSFVSQSTELLNSCFKSYGFALSKTKTSTASNYQFPFEEKEKEEKNSAEEKSLVITWIVESLLTRLNPANELTSYSDPKTSGKTNHVPLYLIIRTLLI
jgi:hypothetical protein